MHNIWCIAREPQESHQDESPEVHYHLPVRESSLSLCLLSCLSGYFLTLGFVPVDRFGILELAGSHWDRHIWTVVRE